MIATENISGKLNQFAEQAQDLIFLLRAKQNQDGISTLSVKEMATVLHTSVDAAKGRIDKLIGLGLVEKIGSNSYKMIHSDLERTSYGAVTKLAAILSDMPNATYKEQAEAMGITQKELEMVYGLLVYLLRT
ncbi:hypothetical protein FE783_25070 [Paenibacillus mesophilus]|uniref:hypothetical protein n=1 Tax=Paenibacillus mesophilus TaxID=2582849 RepID=UPI00110F47E6|nr:hypothetical protein [Paenibacillus mesophilus]TMV46588.1 hypothetical protein FE783_25070 [Paenibacillus mesophilus]